MALENKETEVSVVFVENGAKVEADHINKAVDNMDDELTELPVQHYTDGNLRTVHAIVNTAS